MIQNMQILLYIYTHISTRSQQPGMRKMKEKTLVMIQQLKRVTIEQCQERIRRAKVIRDRPASEPEWPQHQGLFTSRLKQQHGL
jgi:DNA-binding transcriptional MocR family regulator